MKFLRLLFFSFLMAALPAVALAQAKSECVTCHENVNPGLVKQHLAGKMAQAGIDCSACHGSAHKTMDDFKNAKMPTPETCKGCHAQRVEQYRAGKHNLAWFAMKTQAAWHGIPASIGKDGYRGCSGCHKMGEKGLVGAAQGNMGAITHDDGTEAAKYRYGNAQCDACHTRHSFSREEAKDPRACSNCHMGFDHPQYEMYISSKHGIIWAADGTKSDGRAPTCQKCHMTNSNHNVVTSWGFLGLRIPTKENVLALVKVAPSLEKQLKSLAAALPSGNFVDVDDDPQWTFNRALILQAAGVLDANLQPTKRFVEGVVQGRIARGPEEFNKLRAGMKKTCNECHSMAYVNDFFKAADTTIKEVDALYAKAISAVQGLYKDGILKKPKGWDYAPDLLQYYNAPTSIEQELYLIMLEHRQRTFQGAFHVSNDYMHWYGWAPTNTAVNVILEEAKKMREEHAAKKK
ncbi:MAG: multiheme c-type cytochrome [Nitrospirae bacterium]|nr:multiheme c-type cytochrome [Nitrospirota bacterium]